VLSEKLSGVSDGRDVTRIFQNPLMREKLRTILPDQQAASAFMKQLGDEASMHKNAQFVLSGSPTARILAEQEDEGGNPLLTGANTIMSGWRGAALKLANKALTKERGLTEARVDALAPSLTARGPELARVFQDLERTAGRRTQSHAVGGRTTRTLAQIVGGRTAGDR
jgi:hypothetical protein